MITATVYTIKNGDLYKIGITQHFARQTRELRPDHNQACLNLDVTETFDAQGIVRILHRGLKEVRLY